MQEIDRVFLEYKINEVEAVHREYGRLIIMYFMCVCVCVCVYIYIYIYIALYSVSTSI